MIYVIFNSSWVKGGIISNAGNVATDKHLMGAGRWCGSEARCPDGWSLAGHREHVGQALGEVSFSGSFTEASGGAKDHRCGD